jgi:hypothetical protein
MIEIKLNPSNLAERFARLQSRLPSQLENQRKKLRQIVLQATKRQTPVKTGALKASLRWVTTGDTDVLWGIYYGQYVITGTRPHVIEPVNAKALRFMIGGQVIFAKSVNHPGTKPNDFRRKGILNARFKPVLNDLKNWVQAQVRGA